jgi:hypothetical protein
LRYISGTRHYGLLYKRNDKSSTVTSSGIAHRLFIQPPPKRGTVKHNTHATSTVPTTSSTTTPIISASAMSDANYGGYPISTDGDPSVDYKSISGILIFINGNLISWSSKRQNVVAQSSCESEIYAAAVATNQVIWARNFLIELKFPQPLPSLLSVDNEAARIVFQSQYLGSKVAHVAIPWHVIWNYHKDKILQYERVSTKDNIADIMTKSLSPIVFKPLRDSIVSLNPNSQSS